MNTHKLMTKCKRILIFKYKCSFSKACPTQKEIVSTIRSEVFQDESFKDISSESIIEMFYTNETGQVEHIKRKKASNKKQLSEGCRVTPEPTVPVIVSRKTQVFSRYINPHNVDLSTVPF